MVLTSLPSCLLRIGLISFLCSSTRARESHSFFCPRVVYPTMSVNIIAASLRSPCDKLGPQYRSTTKLKTVYEWRETLLSPEFTHVLFRFEAACYLFDSPIFCSISNHLGSVRYSAHQGNILK